MLRILKNPEEEGKPAASNRVSRRFCIKEKEEDEDGTRACERRSDKEKGKASTAAVEVKY